MKKRILFSALMLSLCFYGQEQNRIQVLENQLNLMAVDHDALLEPLKLNFKSETAQLAISDLLLAVSSAHQLNISVDPQLKNYFVNTQFSNATVLELLLFLCKEKNITIEFTANIMAFKPFVAPAIETPEPELVFQYDPVLETVTLEAQKNPLHEVFRAFTLQTGINIVYKPTLQDLPIDIFLVNTPMEQALKGIAQSHGLAYVKSSEGYYLFDYENPESSQNLFDPMEYNHSEPFGYKVLDTLNKRISVHVNRVSVSSLLRNLTQDLKIDYYLASPLEGLGEATLKAKNIHFDDLLYQLFSNYPAPTQKQSEAATNQNLENTSLVFGDGVFPEHSITYKKTGDTYFFGEKTLLSLRSTKTIPLVHRSIEILDDPFRVSSLNQSLSTTNNYTNFYNSSGTSNRTPSNFGSVGGGIQSTSNTQPKGETLTLDAIVPDELKQGLEIKPDLELNSFFVSGTHTQIKRFENFIAMLDQTVPVILIEVMFLEINHNSVIESGVSWGIGEKQATTQGSLFPNTDLTLDSKTINRIIGGFNGFGTLNLGKVIPEFFSKIKILETNGALKILSTPKMATLNGHRAQFTNNETSYYVVTSQNIFGSQIPQSSQIKNYFPIQAGLTLSVKPFVAGDSEITLDIFVTQSIFTERISPEAPPGIEAREFSSIIRMRDQDIAILGGLDQRSRSNSGQGIPLLSKIPLLKWLFSQRKRNGSKRKLTVLIKPTRIN